MMRIAGDPLRVGPIANGKQQHPATASDYGIGNGERQTAGAADDGEWTVIDQRRCGQFAHGSSSTSARRTAIVNGCEPERMKAITLATSASSPLLAATASSRSRNVPAPKKMAS